MPTKRKRRQPVFTDAEMAQARADLEASRRGLHADPGPAPARGPASKSAVAKRQREIRTLVAKQDAARYGDLQAHKTSQEPLFRWIMEPIPITFSHDSDSEEDMLRRVNDVRKCKIEATLASQPLGANNCEELLSLIQVGNLREAKKLLDDHHSRWLRFWHRELGLAHRPPKPRGTTENLRIGQCVAEAIVANKLKKKAAIALVQAQHAKETGIHLSAESISKYHDAYKRNARWMLGPKQVAKLAAALVSQTSRNR